MRLGWLFFVGLILMLGTVGGLEQDTMTFPEFFGWIAASFILMGIGVKAANEEINS